MKDIPHEDIAADNYFFQLTEKEMAEIIRLTPPRVSNDFSFGIGWVGIDWAKGQAKPNAVKILERLRGQSTGNYSI